HNLTIYRVFPVPLKLTELALAPGGDPCGSLYACSGWLRDPRPGVYEGGALISSEWRDVDPRDKYIEFISRVYITPLRAYERTAFIYPRARVAQPPAACVEASAGVATRG